LVSLKRFGHISYASDFSGGSQRALTYALSLAEEDRSELTFLHVIESEPASESELLEWKRLDREKLSQMMPPEVDLAYKPEIEIEIGIPEVEIVRLADSRKAELIVMGSHPGGSVDALAVDDSAPRLAACPLPGANGPRRIGAAQAKAPELGSTNRLQNACVG
jgi:nucleotide-binding universal stress UspA family protein